MKLKFFKEFHLHLFFYFFYMNIFNFIIFILFIIKLSLINILILEFHKENYYYNYYRLNILF